MTYLDIVNNVLRRLRERPVETVNQTDYSRLIAILVNDAKEEVENAWNWSQLRTTLQGDTVIGQFNMELGSTESRLQIIDIWNDDTHRELQPRNVKWFNERFLGDPTPETGEPLYWSFNGTSADGDSLVDLYPIPDAVYTLLFNCTARQIDLTNDSDVLQVPDKPVQLLTYAMAIEERGEDGGQLSTRAFEKARMSLADAVAYDAAKHEDETIWYSE